MDPFQEVEQDCWAQVRTLEHFIRTAGRVTHDSQLDFNNNYQELAETLEDLRQAVHISESNPAQFSLSSEEIAGRKQILGQLSRKIASLQTDWENHVANPHRPREVTTMSNRISHEETRMDVDGRGYGNAGTSTGDFNTGNTGNAENAGFTRNTGNTGYGDTNDTGNTGYDTGTAVDREFNRFQQQEMLHTQDLQLDSIHKTMQNLNQQAAMMGGELEDQGYLLDELDSEMDTVGAKLQRGMKRVNYVIEKNRETASNWCIGILVVVLCVLLFVLIVL